MREILREAFPWGDVLDYLPLLAVVVVVIGIVASCSEQMYATETRRECVKLMVDKPADEIVKICGQLK